MSKMISKCILVIVAVLLAAGSAAAAGTPHVNHVNNGNAWFWDPMVEVETEKDVTAVEGYVTYEDGTLDEAYGILNGNIWVKTGTAMDQSDWVRTWGYTQNTAVDVAANSGEAWAITNTKRVLHRNHYDVGFRQIEGPLDETQTPLGLEKIDVDGEGMPWVITEDGHLHRLISEITSEWELQEVGRVDIHDSHEIFPWDVACSDDGIIFVTGSLTGKQFPQYNCVWAFDESDMQNALASHCGLSGMLPDDQQPGLQWHMLGPIDVDAQGVLWTTIDRKWRTASGDWRNRVGYYRIPAIAKNGDVDITIDYDNIEVNEALIQDVGAQ